jgi:hypothetical protein
MPTMERITDNIIPQTAPKPIPSVTVTTRPHKPLENAGQQIKTDGAPAAESPAKTEESVRLSPQLSALARKEQALVKERLALKAEREQMASDLAEAAKFKQLKTKMSAKDFSDMEELGLNYEDYVKHVLNKQEGEDPKEKRVQELEAKLQSLEKSLEESAANNYEETIAEYRKEISKLISDNPDFSTIKGLKREDAVLQLILDAFEKDNEELTVAEAAQQIEEYLVGYGNTFTSLPKFKKEEPVKQLPRPVVGKTLTNNMSAGSDTKGPLKSLQHLSEAERYAEARRRVEARKGK